MHMQHVSHEVWTSDHIFSGLIAIHYCKWLSNGRINLETIMTTSKQVTVICDFGHRSSSSNLDVRKNMMRRTVVECTWKNKETIMTTSKQVTDICDFGHSSSSSNLDVKKTWWGERLYHMIPLMMTLATLENKVFNSQASQRRKHTRRHENYCWNIYTNQPFESDFSRLHYDQLVHDQSKIKMLNEIRNQQTTHTLNKL
jgi:hypothetical protein